MKKLLYMTVGYQNGNKFIREFERFDRLGGHSAGKREVREVVLVTHPTS